MATTLSNRVLFVAWMLALRAMMELAYVSTVASDFAYAGFYYDPNGWFRLLTYGMTFLFALLIPMARNVTSATVLIFYLVFFIPFGIIASSTYKSIDYYLLVCMSMAILIAFARHPPPKTLNIGKVAYGTDLFVMGSIAGILATVALFIAMGGMALINFNVSIIYDFRWDINEILTGPLGYLMDWSKNVFLPGLFMFSLWKKNPIYIASTLFAFFLFFGITSAKSMLAYPIFLTAIYLGIKYKKLTSMFVLGATTVILLPWAAYELVGQNLFTAATIMRIYFVPPLDAYRYFEYFELTEKMFMMNTMLGLPFRTNEMQNVAMIIGDNAWGIGSATYTNAGIFATGYMHFGAVGMAVFPLVVGFLLRLLDKLSIGRVPEEIAMPFGVSIAINFLSSDLTTTLLSHGMGLAFVVLILIGNKEGMSPTAHRSGSQPMRLPAATRR